LKIDSRKREMIQILNGKIIRLYLFLFILLVLAVLSITALFYGVVYKKYVVEKLRFVNYQFENIIKNAFEDIEFFAKYRTAPLSSLAIIEVNSDGKVEAVSPEIEIYKNFYFSDDDIFKATIERGEYVSGFTNKFLTETPAITVSKRYNNKIYISILELKEIYRNSQVLDANHQLFFVDRNGFGINIDKNGYRFTDFFALRSTEDVIPILGLRYLNFNNQIHLLFEKKLSHDYRSVITIPLVSFLEIYLLQFGALAALLILIGIISSWMLSRELYNQLKPIHDLSEHMLNSSLTSFKAEYPRNSSIEIETLINSYNRMVKNEIENRTKLSVAVKKLTYINERMQQINTLLILSDEMLKRFIASTSEVGELLREYFEKVIENVKNLKYLRYDGEFGSLEFGVKVENPIVVSQESEKLKLFFEEENDKNDFVHSTIAQLLLNFIKDLKFAIRIQNLIRHDSLTQLLNRRYFDELLEREIVVADRYGRSFTYILIDLDNFKYFNDIYGHQFGDKVLKEFGDLLSKSFRQSDLVGRFGGDEFQILMLEASREKVCEKLNLIEKNAAKLQVEGINVNLEFCYGMSKFPDDGKTKDELFEVADRELYRMKSVKKASK